LFGMLQKWTIGWWIGILKLIHAAHFGIRCWPILCSSQTLLPKTFQMSFISSMVTVPSHLKLTSLWCLLSIHIPLSVLLLCHLNEAYFSITSISVLISLLAKVILISHSSRSTQSNSREPYVLAILLFW